MRTRIELRVVILRNKRETAEAITAIIKEKLKREYVYVETIVDDEEEGETTL